jgi:predicted RNA-binding protein with PUA-like domain
MVDLALGDIFEKPVYLHQLKDLLNNTGTEKEKAVLANMILLKKGSRLSIQPVSAEQWDLIINIAKGGGSEDTNK